MNRTPIRNGAHWRSYAHVNPCSTLFVAHQTDRRKSHKFQQPWAPLIIREALFCLEDKVQQHDSRWKQHENAGDWTQPYEVITLTRRFYFAVRNPAEPTLYADREKMLLASRSVVWIFPLTLLLTHIFHAGKGRATNITLLLLFRMHVLQVRGERS